MFVKARFDRNMKKEFNMFDAIGRLEVIEEFLKQELDFPYLQAQGIIEEHFPMHKGDGINDFKKSYDHFWWKLLIGFLTGNFLKYFEPINLVKNYYGEKYAFEYAFLLHYQAWLLIPTVGGCLVFMISLQQMAVTGNIKESLDTTFNGLFGLSLALWATMFVESWKRKQRAIQYLWNCSDNSFSKYDERDEEFTYFELYN